MSDNCMGYIYDPHFILRTLLINQLIYRVIYSILSQKSCFTASMICDFRETRVFAKDFLLNDLVSLFSRQC